MSTRALRDLVRLVDDEDIRIRARTGLSRMALSKALHIHQGTGRMAGPHSRAYHSTVIGEDTPEVQHVVRWIEDGTYPTWLRDALDFRPASLDIVETALAERQGAIVTHLTPDFAMGTSTRESWGQSNVLIVHYSRPGEGRNGVIYTRYLTNDKWLGSFYHSSDRSTSRNLLDEGSFFGVQEGTRSLGLYTKRPPWRGRKAEDVSSSRANVIWTGAEGLEVYVGSKAARLPAEVPEGEVVVVSGGSIMTAVRPLTRTQVGDLPVRIVERGGDLILVMPNYEGDIIPASRLDSLSGGKRLAGLYTEVADRSAYLGPAEFAAHVASGAFATDLVEAAADSGGTTRYWSASYTRDGQTVGLEVDVDGWTLKRRWNASGDMGWPMLESQIARQNRSGNIEVADAVLKCGKEAGWLFVPPGSGKYIAGYHGTQPVPVTLEVPGGRVEVARMATGTIVWDKGKVIVEAVGLEGEPVVSGGTLSRR